MIVSSFSGGLASAISTERAIVRYDRDQVAVWFSDTSWEDDDLYRFRDECLKRWNIQYIEYREGRNPLEVSRDEHVIPNNFLAPCTFRLKIDPFTKFLQECAKPVTVALGLGWEEQHRMITPKKRYEAIEGVTVDYPLMWRPLEFRSYYQIVKDDWKIEPPRLYKMGFSHNNCGGRCVKQGQGDWRKLKINFPERFIKCRDWESDMRTNPVNSNYAFLKTKQGGETHPLPLTEIEKSWLDIPCGNIFPNETEDMYGCFCGF